jgi:hypothetical protein
MRQRPENPTPRQQISFAFEDYMISHTKLDEILSEVLFYLLRSTSVDIVNIIGPTGIGKTALMHQLQHEVIKAKSEEMASNPEMRPFIMNTAMADGYHVFSHKGLYQEALLALADPFHAIPIRPKAKPTPSGLIFAGSNGRPTTASLRARLEKQLMAHLTAVWGIDEGQHAILHAERGAPKHQIDVFKSISQRTSTKLCLFGPPELEAHLRSSGQLARRVKTLYFQRYRSDIQEDVNEFGTVAARFFEVMNVKSAPDVGANIDFLYEYSQGCIGILKTWLQGALDRALDEATSTNNVRVTLAHLEKARLDTVAMVTIQAEIEHMEKTLSLNNSKHLRARLLLTGAEAEMAPRASRSTPNASKSATHRPLKPGTRSPTRDRVGSADVFGEEQ